MKTLSFDTPANESLSLAESAARACRPEMLRSALAHHGAPLDGSGTGSSLVRAFLETCAASDKDYINHPSRPKARYLECLDALISAGADMEALERDGQNALHFAARHLSGYFIEALLDRGADPNAQTLGGMSAFHIAIAQAREPVARLLAARGADVSLPDFEGATPLHTAVVSENPHTILWLLSLGASTTALDGEGLSPWQLCVRCIGPNDEWVPTLKNAFIEGEVKELERQAGEARPKPRSPRSL